VCDTISEHVVDQGWMEGAWPASDLFLAIVRDCENYKAAILGRAFALVLDREIQEAAILGCTFQLKNAVSTNSICFEYYRAGSCPGE
jgi:hypothetical protein